MSQKQFLHGLSNYSTALTLTSSLSAKEKIIINNINNKLHILYKNGTETSPAKKKTSSKKYTQPKYYAVPLHQVVAVNRPPPPAHEVHLVVARFSADEAAAAATGFLPRASSSAPRHHEVADGPDDLPLQLPSLQRRPLLL